MAKLLRYSGTVAVVLRKRFQRFPVRSQSHVHVWVVCTYEVRRIKGWRFSIISRRHLVKRGVGCRLLTVPCVQLSAGVYVLVHSQERMVQSQPGLGYEASLVWS